MHNHLPAIKLKTSRAYLSESYDQFQRYGSRRLVIERVFGSSAIMLGIGLHTYSSNYTITAIVLVVIGICELLTNRVRKYFWLRHLEKTGFIDSEVEIKPNVEGSPLIEIISSDASEQRPIQRAIRTPKGLIIWTKKGSYYYFPDSALGKATLNKIHANIKKTNTKH